MYKKVNLLVSLIGFLVLIALVLASCGTYQPPGKDLWLTLN